MRPGAATPLVLGLAAALGCSAPQERPGALGAAHGADGGTTAALASGGATGGAPQRARADGGAGGRGDLSDGREARLVARMLRRVSEARGLAATRAVPSVALSRPDLIAQVKVRVEKEVPTEAIRNEGLAMHLLGMVPVTLDYEATTYSMLEAQLAGFYEPSDGTMYLAADLAEELADATLAHELVHALQDQHWPLDARMKYQSGMSDASTAFHALAEGDATSAMVDIMASRQRKGMTALDLPDALISQQMMEGSMGPESASTPHAMLASLLSPYVEGTRFVNALRRSGGWAAVDEAWGRPPQTTEQLLHVDKWRSAEGPLAVSAPDPRALGAAFRPLDEDTYGELGLRLLLSEWLGDDDAAVAVRGWGGDRATLAADGDRSALAIHLRYDDGAPPAVMAKARGTVKRLSRGWKRAFGPLAVDTTETFACVERRSLGPLAVARRGRDLIFVAGPARMQGTTWSAAGTCADAARWADAIAPR